MSKIFHPLLALIASATDNQLAKYVEYLTSDSCVDYNAETIGIENDKFSNEDKMNLHLVNLLKSRLSAEHLVHVDLRFESLNGQRVLVVKCRPSNLPVYYKEGKTELFYTRTGAATSELLPSQIQGYLKQRF